jgi:hypothetical protein
MISFFVIPWPWKNPYKPKRSRGFSPPLPLQLHQKYDNPRTGNTVLSKKRRGGQEGQAFVPSTSFLMLLIIGKNDNFYRVKNSFSFIT